MTRQSTCTAENKLKYYASQGASWRFGHQTAKGWFSRQVIAPPQLGTVVPPSSRSGGLLCPLMTIKQLSQTERRRTALVISDHADWNEPTETITATGMRKFGHSWPEMHSYWQQRGLDAEPLYLQGREGDSSE